MSILSRVLKDLKTLFRFAALFLIIIVFSLFVQSRQKNNILDRCVTHNPFGNSHYHTQLIFERDGKKVIIPANVGIRIANAKACMHPFHTHDETGRVHIDYPPSTTFTLGDFFDVLGLILNDTQVGDARVLDGYKITVTVNGGQVKNNFRGIALKDKEIIKITVISP